MSAPHFEIRIGDDGTAEVDGEPLFPPPGGSVHDVVLDLLQGHAQRLGVVVEATVNNEDGRATFLLEVAPDGSSRIPSAGGPTAAEEEPTDLTESDFTERALAEGDLTETAAPAPVPVPVPASARVPVPVPGQLLDRVRTINSAAAEGELTHALEMATELREHLAGAEGDAHPYALEARAMEAYLAYLCGEHRQATVLALAVARIRCGAGDARAADEVARAAAAWRRLDDDIAAVAHGRELLHMWEALERRELLPPVHRELADQVRRHLHWLAAAA
ncbi:hypothetical protein ACIQI8_34280 [Streptomyces sp. NPDC092369]|uniref:hypothetical protein n=1 Tax=Streptomyces sp. NPDC092369 TaxID=3366015 RepID=UPI0038231BA8